MRKIWLARQLIRARKTRKTDPPTPVSTSMISYTSNTLYLAINEHEQLQTIDLVTLLNNSPLKCRGWLGISTTVPTPCGLFMQRKQRATMKPEFNP
jgi:hypothetical protein